MDGPELAVDGGGELEGIEAAAKGPQRRQATELGSRARDQTIQSRLGLVVVSA
jgi:hypothetical protein